VSVSGETVLKEEVAQFRPYVKNRKAPIQGSFPLPADAMLIALCVDGLVIPYILATLAPKTEYFWSDGRR